MEQELLTAQEAADFLKVKKATVYEMVKRGTVPAVKIGKQVRIDRKILESLLNPLTTTPTAVPETPAAGEGVVLCGQDSCLNIIANHVSMLPGARTVLRSYAGSYNSLNLLYQGKVDIATSHLWDGETDTYNFPFITRLLPGVPVVVVRLLGRDMGLYVKHGNPKNIKDLDSLRGGKISVVNREKGSGTRILMDQKLKMLHINAGDIPGYDREYQNHLSIAGAVARGEADLGMGAETAARQVDGVDFLPIQKEWYDLVFPESRAKEPTFRLLLDYLTTEFSREIAATGHYDLSQTGQVFHL
jgi:putative molybdopterin biosynthesis protein